MDSFKKLIEILVSMVDAHTRLLDLTKEKRTILIKGDHKSLLQITHRENSCATEIERLEVQRQQYVEDYIAAKGYKSTSFTLEDMIALQTNPEIKTTLTAIAKKLRILVQEVAHLNKGNQQLIETSLSYIQYTIGMFVQNETPIGYGPKSKNGYASLLDAKI